MYFLKWQVTASNAKQTLEQCKQNLEGANTLIKLYFANNSDAFFRFVEITPSSSSYNKHVIVFETSCQHKKFKTTMFRCGKYSYL